MSNNEVPVVSGGTAVSSSGSGIASVNGVVVLLNSTIVAQNRAARYPDIISSVDSASGYSLIGDDSGASDVSNGVNNNKIGTSAAPVNAGLDSLRNNGGAVATMALQSGSPALDAALSNGLDTDQRRTGFARTVDLAGIPNVWDGSDIGAFEAQSAAASKVNTSVDLSSSRNPSRAGDAITFTASVIESNAATPTGTLTFRVDGFIAATRTVGTAPATYATNTLSIGLHSVRVDYSGDANFRPSSSTLLQTVEDATSCSTVVSNTNDAGEGSIRAAIDCANSNADDSAITFDAGGVGTIQLAIPLPALTTNMTIHGPSSSSLTVRRNSGGNYSIFRVTGSGAQPTVTISSMTVSNGNSTDGGGALQNSATLTLRECAFTDNSALFGGAVYSTGTLTAQYCTFRRQYHS